MNNYLNNIKRAVRAAVATMGIALLATIFLPAGAAWATPGNTPVFNSFPNATYTGDERDFLRVWDSAKQDYVNSVEACDGELTLWVYVHNDQESSENGDNYDGPAVAHGTRMAVSIPGGKSKTLVPSAKITADNADTVIDTVNISCSDYEIELEYIPGSATSYTGFRGYTNLSDDVVYKPEGTLIGSFADDGVVPACWEYRVWVTMKVRVKKVKPKPKPIYRCDSLSALAVDRYKRKLTAKATAKNGADVVGYEFNFGDGTSQTVNTSTLSASVEHTYAAGTYTASVKVNFDTDSDGKADKSDVCRTKIKVTDAPAAVCRKLTATVDPKNIFKFSFAVDNYLPQGADVVSYSYDLGDGNQVVTTDNPYVYTYDKAGTYTVTVTVTYNVEGKTQTDTCSTEVEIKPQVKPAVKKKELPNTGPAASALAGFFGSGSLFAGVRHWLESKRNLRRSLLKLRKK